MAEPAPTRIVGRESEQETLDRVLSDVRGGVGRVLVITGEAGIGKTTLLNYAAEQARDLRVLRCAGVESEIELPFAGIHQIVWPLMDNLGNLSRPQAEALRGAMGLETAGGDRFLIGIAVLTLLSDLAETRPVLLLVEDAHWLDTPSAEALLFAARRLEAEHIGILMAAREGAAREFHRGDLPHMPLGGLDRDAANQLLERSGQRYTSAVRDRLLLETEGNPLALLELGASLSPDELEGRAPLPERLPLASRVQGAYLARVEQLPAETRQLLLLAAAEGSNDMAAVLTAGRAVGIEADSLDPAEKLGLIVTDERVVRFRHPLVRSAMYGKATLSERLAAHRALAQVLTRSGEEDRRTWHLASATIGSDEAVAEALEAVGDRAERRRASGTAALALERAAALSVDNAARALRLAKGARYAFEAGHWLRAETLATQGEAVAEDPHLIADCMLTRSLLQFETANLDTAWVTVLQAADAIPEKTEQAADDIAALLTVAARLAWFSGEIARLEQARDRILALPGPPNSLRRRLALSMVGLFLPPGHVPPRGFLAAALETFGSPVGSPWMWPPGLCAAAVGEDSAALQLYSREVASLRAAGSIGELAQALVGLGYAESYLGLWSNAVVHASEGLRLSRETDQPGGTGLCLGLLARIAGAQGRADDCRRYTAEALDRVTTQGSIAVVSVTRWGLGQLALGLGDPEQAYAQLSAIASPERWPDGNVFAPISALDLVEAAILAGRREDAFSTLKAMRNLTRGFGLAWAELVTERSLALLSDGPDAEEHFRAALAVPGAELRRFEFARTQLVFGEWLRRNRRRAEARRLLRSSLEAFTASGAGPWARRAQSELRASGARTEQGGQVALEALTPQELQVVRLAARGLSNREIGTQLFLSPRTVGFHLYKAYPKLGVASRSELGRLQLEEPDLTEARSG